MAKMTIELRFSNPKWYELDYYILRLAALCRFEKMLSNLIKRRIKVIG